MISKLLLKLDTERIRINEYEIQTTVYLTTINSAKYKHVPLSKEVYLCPATLENVSDSAKKKLQNQLRRGNQQQLKHKLVDPY